MRGLSHHHFRLEVFVECQQQRFRPGDAAVKRQHKVAQAVAVTVEGIDGRRAEGWGETPLSVTWAWPSSTMSYAARYEAMVSLCQRLAKAWADGELTGRLPMTFEVVTEGIEIVVP